ncbi:hypothetical protein ACIBG8_14705 [Nonomuraea sp. NPDC050556]|uniref:hypothetical protein n=1 Tax=Nonomuraea sp. NPDC050556 TaxID=3364369 RepID=UPI0037BBD51F
MSFHLEWERLARQAYDQIPPHLRLPVADAIIRLMIEGIPTDAEPGQDGRWTLHAGDYVLVFVENELDIYLVAIEHA